MAKLPFVVQPRLKPVIERIGSEDSGIIEIERRGYLTSGEKSFVQQIQTQDTGTVELISLSRRISSEKGITLDKAYSTLVEIITNEGKSKFAVQVEAEYAEKIQETLNKLTSSRLREDLIQAACLIMYRIDSNFGIEDIMDIHPDIINGLSLLYKEEENKSIERLLVKQDEEKGNELSVEQIEKKQKETEAA